VIYITYGRLFFIAVFETYVLIRHRVGGFVILVLLGGIMVFIKVVLLYPVPILSPSLIAELWVLHFVFVEACVLFCTHKRYHVCSYYCDL